jgi:hypothetical protein
VTTKLVLHQATRCEPRRVRIHPVASHTLPISILWET